MSSIDVDELDDAHEQRRTFRYSNGAPLVSDPDDPEKTLRYSRPSGYSKVLDDEKALESWRIWKSMTGVARSPALAAEVNACKDEDRTQKEVLRNKALDKGDASEKADMGTALHAMTVRAEDSADVDFDPPEQYVPDLTAYTDALEAYGLVSEMFEVALVNDEFRAAGTADRIYRTTKPLISPDGIRIEIGELILGDLKTGKMDFSMPNFCVQTFLYATGKLYDVITDRRLATPPINQNWSLLIHLPVGKAKCEVLWCPLEIGRIGAQMARSVKEWRKLWKNGTYDCPVVGAPVDPLDELSSELGAEVVGEVTLATMSEYCQSRIVAIGGHDQARKWLLMQWPEGLPSPKKGITSDDQILQLLNLLDEVERRFSLPFGTSDPRLQVQHDLHRSQVDRSNEFLLDIS
jgi:hypothetical protein